MQDLNNTQPPIKINTTRQKLIKEIKLMLGFGMVQLELTPDHYNLAIDIALDRYRQKSPNSTEERIGFLELQPGVTEYYLPSEVILVKNIFRRNTAGTATGVGVNFDPFGEAFVNQFVLDGGNQASLVTYELFSEFQKTVGKMFGLYINFVWHPTEHRLDITRDIRAIESVLLWIHNYRPEEVIFTDMYARPWIRDYSVAKCKLFLGESRGKYNSLPGPQGALAFNWEALKNEAKEEITRLEEELKNMVDQDQGYGFLIG